jgi:branched-chain amino acid transport system permease protein
MTSSSISTRSHAPNGSSPSRDGCHVSIAFWFEQTLNGLQLGAMLFLMAAGLTLVLGIMNLVNLAHGSLYMCGAFLAATFVAWSGSTTFALPAAILATGVLGLLLEATVLRVLYERNHLDQVLCTFGVILVANELMRIIWGPVPLNMPIPDVFAGSIGIFGLQYSTYRILIIVVGIAAAVLLYLLLARTRSGMLVRAGASDRMMIQVLGVNITRLNHFVFAVGAGLAGLAGAMAGPLLAVQSGMGEPVLIVTLVVIVIGGIGSIRGGFVAAMLIGLIDTFGRVLLPAALGSIIIYLLMAVILLFRPSGLFPATGAAADETTKALSSLHSSNPSLQHLKMRTFAVLATLLFFGLVPIVADAMGEPFYIKFFTRTMLFGIAALSLGLILNYGGMVSFGHAAFVGVAAYVVAILGFHATDGSSIFGLPGTHNAFIAWPIAIGCSATAAFFIGAVSVRTTGLYFIMITLAFAQMLFYLFIALTTYGGESGLQMSQRSALWPIDLEDRTSFYYLVFGIMIGCMALTARLVRSPFGLVLNGCRQNERRMRAIGVSTYRYRLAAFTISGAMAGVAGILLANLQAFATPIEMSWSRSGEFLIMVILGGSATLAGPLLGALMFQLVELFLEGWTEHWELFFGLLLIAYVLCPPRRAWQFLRSLRRYCGWQLLHWSRQERAA